MDMEKLKRELEENRDLKDVTESPEGRAAASRVDADALREALSRGDVGALKQQLSQLLSTPEGKALAERVQKAVGKSERA